MSERDLLLRELSQLKKMLIMQEMWKRKVDRQVQYDLLCQLQGEVYAQVVLIEGQLDVSADEYFVKGSEC